MKKDESTAVICPFYRGEKHQQIFCEGFVLNASVSHNFANSADKNKFRRFFCDGEGYPACPIAAALLKSYERENEDER